MRWKVKECREMPPAYCRRTHSIFSRAPRVCDARPYSEFCAVLRGLRRPASEQKYLMNWRMMVPWREIYTSWMKLLPVGFNQPREKECRGGRLTRAKPKTFLFHPSSRVHRSPLAGGRIQDVMSAYYRCCIYADCVTVDTSAEQALSSPLYALTAK